MPSPRRELRPYTFKVCLPDTGTPSTRCAEFSGFVESRARSGRTLHEMSRLAGDICEFLVRLTCINCGRGSLDRLTKEIRSDFPDAVFHSFSCLDR